jgi:paraquat-inducible protein B
VLGGIAIATAALIALGGGQLFSDMERASIFFQGSVNGLQIGSPVKIQGVPVGQVIDIRAIVDETKPGQLTTHTETVIEIDERRFDQTTAARREIELPSERRGSGGDDSRVRAQLNLQSLLTGQLYVALTIAPDVEGHVGPAHLARYEQIPSIPTSFEVIEATARELLERFRTLPLEELIDNSNETIVALGDLARDPALPNAAKELEGALRDTRKLVRRLDGQVDPLSEQALAALQELETTLAAAEVMLEPGSPVVYQLGATLQEVSQAAQAMRALANTLERQPNAIVFGKAGETE